MATQGNAAATFRIAAVMLDNLTDRCADCLCVRGDYLILNIDSGDQSYVLLTDQRAFHCYIVIPSQCNMRLLYC